MKWLEGKASAYADLEMVKIMPSIRASLMKAYIKGFEEATILAINNQKENGKDNEGNTSEE